MKKFFIVIFVFCTTAFAVKKQDSEKQPKSTKNLSLAQKKSAAKIAMWERIIEKSDFTFDKDDPIQQSVRIDCLKVLGYDFDETTGELKFRICKKPLTKGQTLTIKNAIETERKKLPRKTFSNDNESSDEESSEDV